MKTLEALINAYLSAYHGKTLANKKAIHARFQGYCSQKNITLENLTTVAIDTYLAHLAESGLAKNSVRSAGLELRQITKYASENGYLIRPLIGQIRVPAAVPRSVQRWYSVEECQGIISAAQAGPKTALLAIYLALFNGLRREDILSAKVSDTRKDGQATLLHLPRRKGGRSSTVPLPQCTVNLLPDTGRLVPLKPAELYAELNRIGKRAGLDAKLRPHSLRTTFITQALDAGVSEREVMLSAGHLQLATTAYYDQGYKSARSKAPAAVVDRIMGP